MYEDHHFTRDSAIVQLKEADGITVDEDGETKIEWDNVKVVKVDQPPHAEAFGTTRFYKLPATVARPIRQPYRFGNDTIWLKKPREELKKAAWSLDNAPWTFGHPETGMVKDIDDIRGFWKNPRYIDSTDDLDADLHIPVDDNEAREFVSDNGDVSVGFYNRVSRVDEYDGIVGGEDSDDDGLDGYQTSMYFDHVASVSIGRCPSSQGCGIDEAPHGHMDTAFISGTRITDEDRGADDTGSMETDYEISPSSVDSATMDYRDEDGRYFAVGPGENPDGIPKYPINSCSDVSDAWKLRRHGDIGISVEDLEGRIKRRASSLDCSNPDPEADSGCGCGCGNKITIEKVLKLKE